MSISTQVLVDGKERNNALHRQEGQCLAVRATGRENEIAYIVLWTFALPPLSLFHRVPRLGGHRSATFRSGVAPARNDNDLFIQHGDFFLPYSRLISSARNPRQSQVSGSWLSSRNHNTHIILKTRSSQGFWRRKRCGANGWREEGEKKKRMQFLSRREKGEQESSEARWRSRCSHSPISEISMQDRRQGGRHFARTAISRLNIAREDSKTTLRVS